MRVLLASWWTKLLRWDFWFSFWWSPEGKNFPNLLRGSRCAFMLVSHTRHTLSSCECFEPNCVPFYMGTTFSPCNFSFSQMGVCVCRIFPVFSAEIVRGFPLIFHIFSMWRLNFAFVCIDFKISVLVVQISSPFRQPDCLVAFRVPRTCVHQWPPCWPRGKTSSMISKVFWFASVTFCEVVQKSPKS